MKMKRFAAGLVCLAVLSSVCAAPATETKFLANRHIERGQQCDTCHEKDMKIKMNGDLEACTACHGDYEAMIQRTEGRYETNPHAQHEGLLPCIECHKGHKEGVNYCGGCHNFEFKVP